MTYRTVTIDDLYNKHSEPTLDLYVYTIETNPKGAGKNTDAHLIGTAETYTQAADLWDAACATADAIGVGCGAIGLCIHEDAVQDAPSLRGYDDDYDVDLSNVDLSRMFSAGDPVLTELHGGY